MKGAIRSFSDKQTTLKKFITSKMALNIKGSLLRVKEKVTTRNKIYERKKITGDGKYMLKELDQ